MYDNFTSLAWLIDYGPHSFELATGQFSDMVMMNPAAEYFEKHTVVS
jgi:hypothetical protein